MTVKKTGIPTQVLEFLKGPTLGALGIADSTCTPRVLRAFSWGVSDNGTVLRTIVPETFKKGVKEVLEDNRQAALVIGNPVTHEAFQLKGIAKAEAPTENDLAVFDTYKNMMITGMLSFGYPEQIANAIFGDPGLTVALTVRDVFVQTPGPGAGGRLSNEEG